MSRIAIIDLGTNTFHLLIAEISESKTVSLVYNETADIKLGEGSSKSSRISVSAFDRGIAALKKFKLRINEYKADKTIAAATSAIRTASNGQEFIEKAGLETGIEPIIIEGEREAELIYKGVKEASPLPETTLIMDIGGGSVEFIICNNEEIFWKKSYPIGAARMMERFHHSDPVSDTDSKAFIKFLDHNLADLMDELSNFKPLVLIGSAGAFETFAALADPPFFGSFEKPEYTFNLEEFKSIAEGIIKSNHDQRMEIAAIPEVRKDMIVIATLLTVYILKKSAVRALKLSAYSLKEGLLFNYLAKPRN